MRGDDWQPDDAFWYVDQESRWVRLLRRYGRSRLALAAISASLLLIIVCSVLALSLHGQPAAHGLGPGAGLPQTTPSNGAAQAATLPVGMPMHFAFGVMNSPGDVGLLNDMRTHNGTSWDFRYQYLAGGVNTGQGWETWNSPAGQFATNYVQESAKNGYIPALVYYELRQSNGTCANCDDGSADRTNLADPKVMAAYYANWRLLMQKIGQFDKPVLVIVEPDLWGFLQQSVVFGSNSAAAVPASVASSGDPDAAGLANTAQGFAQALLHMRDRYAPNALLTLHVSFWATLEDIGSSTDVSLSAQQVASATAQFLQTAGLTGNPKGISTWDLLSSDVSDRDSAQGAAWWDPTNQTVPNFARYLSFISDVSSLTHRRVVMWQVPEGNQYFDTMNDSPQHTQDNRAQYILGHILDFARAGVVAVLFGPGQSGTSVDDGAHDGVTNPHPITSFNCNDCNSHLSTYPDDDGGYLRIFVGAYYRGGVLSLTQPGSWSTWKGPAPVGASATVTPLPAGTCERAPSAAIGQATISPNPVLPGQRISFSVYVTLSCNTAAAMVLNVYEGWARTSILRLASGNEQFTSGKPRLITFTGTLPSTAQPGGHDVTLEVYDTKGVTLYASGQLDVTLVVN